MSGYRGLRRFPWLAQRARTVNGTRRGKRGPMGTIEDLERKVQSLKDQLIQAETSLNSARLAACPISVGEVVVCKYGNERRKVSRREIRWGSTIYLHGYKHNNKGEWGKRESYIGSVDSVKKIEVANGAS